MAKKFIKSKDQKNSPGPGFRTSKFSIKKEFGKSPALRKGFNPGSFKVQHKG